MLLTVVYNAALIITGTGLAAAILAAACYATLAVVGV